MTIVPSTDGFRTETGAVQVLDATKLQDLNGDPLSLGGGTWGSIAGTLSSQTDLNTALGLKAALISPSFTTPALGAATGTTLVLSSTISAINLSGTNTGDNAVNTLYSGLVSNATHTGDATGSGALTLATVNSNVGSFGGSSKTALVTVNAKGLVTAISEGASTPAIASVTGLGTGVGTFLATPSSANLAAALTDETGIGSVVFSASPTITGTLNAAAITASGVVTLPNNTWHVTADAVNRLHFVGSGATYIGSGATGVNFSHYFRNGSGTDVVSFSADGNIIIPNATSVSCKDSGGTPRRTFFLDSSNNYGARNECTSGGAYYGISNAINTGSTFFTAAGSVVLTIATTGAITASGTITTAANGAASTPPVILTGTWFTGGTATTTKPQLLIEPTGTTSTGWSTSGTAFGVNAASGFTGNLFDLQLAGVSKLKADSTGKISCVSTGLTATWDGLSWIASGDAPLAITNTAASNWGLTINNFSGSHTFTHTGRFGVGFTQSTGNAGTGGKFHVKNQTTTQIVSVIQGVASQSANLTEWWNSSGAVLASVSSAGALVVGSGTAIIKVLSATATLNFGSITAGGFEDLTITVTGATVGNTAIANPPTGSVTNNITYDAWISASDTVTVRASNNNLITAMDPASGTFRATVIQF